MSNKPIDEKVMVVVSGYGFSMGDFTHMPKAKVLMLLASILTLWMIANNASNDKELFTLSCDLVKLLIKE